MRSLKWSISHAVFVPEIDDEHKEIFQAVSDLQNGLAGGASANVAMLIDRLIASIVDHFAHEERLMRAARYGSLRWHKQQHDHARTRTGRLVVRIEQGDIGAGNELVEFLTAWLRDHTRVADRMMAAFLRNQRRCVQLTFQAGTKPLDACNWIDSQGEKFDPLAVKSRF